jgi:SAM-dependent methyltransferase
VGIDSHLRLETVDISDVSADDFGRFDVVLTNQCLHHFLELEHALDLVQASLNDGGVVLVSDVIGRNGHQLWPEALREVQRYWERLPDRLRKDHTRGGSSREYVDYDHSNVGFEGIRAQEILAALIERFEFEYFFPYGGIILPFIERRFGWNFDVESKDDRELIDQVATRDHELLWSGDIKPTQLLASLRKERSTRLITDFPLPPSACVRHIKADQEATAKASAGSDSALQHGNQPQL